MNGLGIYQGATPQSIAASLPTVKLWIVHLNPGCGVAIRAANPHAIIILRPDKGDDNAQFDPTKDPQAEARRYADLVSQRLVEVPPSTYSATTGPNEAWPDKNDKAGLRWRAAFELELCRQMQSGLKLPYAWGSIPVGNLEPEDVALFVDVFREAWATNYHAYLGPGRSTILQEIDPYYCWRPTGLWLPELDKLGITLRLLAGECGTYTAPNTYADFDAVNEATLAVDISRHYAANAQATRAYEFVGACAFGVGTVGKMANWDLTSALSVIDDAAKSDLQPGPAVIPTSQAPHPQPKPIPPPRRKPLTDFPAAIWEPSPNFGDPTGTHGRNGHPIMAIVSHVEGGSETATDSEFDNAATQLSTTYSVPKAGPVRQHVREDDEHWGNGIVNTPRLGIPVVAAMVGSGVDVNFFTISIEREGVPDDPMTEEQYGNYRDLVHDILTRRPGIKWLIGHDDLDTINRSFCPGPNHPWARLYGDLRPLIEQNGVTLSHYTPPQEEQLTDQQRKAILDDLDFIYAYARVENITKNPAEAQRVIQERAIALKTTLGLNS